MLKIRLRVGELCREKGIISKSGRSRGTPNASEVARMTGISYAAAFAHVHNPEKIQRVNLETLAAFCEAFQCSPGELFTITRVSPLLQPRLSEQYKIDPDYDPYRTA